MSTGSYRTRVPFSVVWSSERLYQPAETDEPADELADASEDTRDRGTPVEFARPWEQLLDDAWQRIVSRDPEAVQDWLATYRQAWRDSLVVTISEVRHMRLSRGQGHVGVSYPAAAIVDADDPVAAFVTAILAVLDRHVDRSSLPVPRLSEVCDRSPAS